MWWDNHYDDYMEDCMVQPTPKRKTGSRKYCPVCKSYLGLQEPAFEISLHCDECRCWFTWFPGVAKPTAKLDSQIPNRCHCLACQARREQTKESMG